MKKDDTNIHFKLGEMHGDIKSILEEARRTNGRVTKLESEIIPKLDKRVDGIELKIAYWVGGLSVIAWIITNILPKFLSKYL